MAPEPSQNKKKKKNAPDRQQPKWMFPPDEENPALNPKPVSEEHKSKAKEEWDKAYKFLQYQSVTAPMKAPPPAMLLTLVGAFLTSYGFNGTSRLYTTQLASREKLDEWKVELGVKLPPGFPDLVKIFKDWYKQYQEKIKLDMTSSDDDDSEDTKAAKLVNKKRKSNNPVVAKTESTSSSGGSDDSGGSGSSDGSGDESHPVVKQGHAKPSKKLRLKAVEAGSSSSASWSTNSDADDEKVSASGKLAIAKSSSIVTSSNSSSSSSSSGSESEAPLPSEPPKKPKSSSKKVSKATEQPLPKLSPPKPVEPSSKVSTDSSVTLQPTSPTKPVPSNTSSSSSLSESPPEPSPPTTTDTKTKPSKRKRPTAPSSSALSSSAPLPDTATPDVTDPPTKKQKTARNLPFQRVPSDVKIDPKLASNAYRAHDYGDRAHYDLSVTRGKGFTKEKNKKKRGSYRGGAIDVSGGKGIKFE